MKKALILLSLTTLFSCKKAINATQPVSTIPVLLELLVAPKITDANINIYQENHYVYFKRDINTTNKLCIFLPGSGAKPENYKLFVQKAGKMGYHSIGLMYPNPSGIYNNGTCETSTDNDCFYKLRLETLRGTNESALIEINEANSIINRVKKLLQYLQTQYPSDNWKQYQQTNGDLIWNKIVFAGHSQGAGHSVFITKLYPIARAIMLANKDFNTTTNKPAAWYTLPNVNFANNVYGFTHSNDEFSQQEIVWSNLQLSGTIINVDGVQRLFTNTRKLTTSATPSQLASTILAAHSSVAADAFTPKDVNGNAVFDKVWEYLLAF